MIAYIARAHPVVGEVTDITTFKTETMICIKWRPPSSVSCGSIYKYKVKYKYNVHEHYEEITECEHTLTNITPDTCVKVVVCAICTCSSRVLGKCAILNRYTCKFYRERERLYEYVLYSFIHGCVDSYIHTYMYIVTYM